MSDDYASLLTTLIVAVFAVGTIQTYSLMKRWGDAQSEQIRELAEARVRVTDALHHGTQPTEEDLRVAGRTSWTPLLMFRRGIAPYIAGLVWTTVVIILGIQQVRILKWTAAAGDDPDPHLARTSFYMVTGAIALLLTEGIVRAFAQTMAKQFGYLKPLWSYPRAVRAQMDCAVKEYRRTGQLPTLPAPSSAPVPTSAGQGSSSGTP
ncbi:hypothetical protein [Streptomyces sp. SGAir0957]